MIRHLIKRLAPLIKLLYNPLQAMADIAARRPYITGAALALVSTFAYYDALRGQRGVVSQAIYGMQMVEGMFSPYIFFIYWVARGIISVASPVFFIIAVFVPGCLLAASLIDRRSGFTAMLRQHYAAMASCALYGWAVAHILALVPATFIYEPGGPVPGRLTDALRLVPLPYFVFLFVIATRVVLRLSVGRSIGAVALGSLSLAAIPLLSRFLFLLTSPFLLILFIILIKNLLDSALSTQRARENFERNLEASTLNPADASAHYNLGLIYQQRGQLDEAKTCFIRAVEIRPDESDAHYQLGRIAREEGKLAEAIRHFDSVVRLDSEHSQSEVWREIGRTYFQAGQPEDARSAFERFLQKRPSDAEGRYYYGLTLHSLGRREDALNEMRSCIEAVRTSPAYKYRADKRWMDEAEAFLRSQSAGARS
jgi:tetratricopeptide (TPR) repeat protein